MRVYAASKKQLILLKIQIRTALVLYNALSHSADLKSEEHDNINI